MNIWKSHIWTADKEVNMKAIFAIFHVHPRLLWAMTTDLGFTIVFYCFTCLEHEQGCSSLCSYVICENMHSVRSRPSSRPSGVKRERSLGIYQRLKGSEFLSSAGIPQIRGPWTNYESVLSGSVMKVITLTNVEPPPETFPQCTISL